jgi:hypothetical protein
MSSSYQESPLITFGLQFRIGCPTLATMKFSLRGHSSDSKPATARSHHHHHHRRRRHRRYHVPPAALGRGIFKRWAWREAEFAPETEPDSAPQTFKNNMWLVVLCLVLAIVFVEVFYELLKLASNSY